jgi:release factor glutamine methyltransferase
MTTERETWTIRRVLGWTAQHFEKKGVDAPRLTAELLLAHALATTRVRLYVDLDRPLEAGELKSYRELIAKRAEGEPTQYLTGSRDFYNRPFKVDPRALIPRPETELLVEAVLAAMPKDAPLAALDLCTGSGCIAATLAKERPACRVVAVDLSKEACALAQENAAALGVSERVEVREGDLFAPLGPGEDFDVVVSNPPYVTTGELARLQREVQREPRLALDGGEDGLELVRRIASGAMAHLRAGGLLALEIGETQGGAVRALLEGAGFEKVRVEKDWERRDRHAFGTRPAASGPQG